MPKRKIRVVFLLIVVFVLIVGCGKEEADDRISEVDTAPLPAETVALPQIENDHQPMDSPAAESSVEIACEDVLTPQSKLTRALAHFQDAALEKIDSDVDAVSISFTDVKDYWRAKRWADIFRVPLRLIEGTLSVLSTAYDLLTLSASSQIAIGTAESTSQILSVFATINGVWEAGEKLQLALDGPSYTAAIDEMLEDADATTVPPFGFDRGYYRRTILNHLWGVAGQSPLVIVERASSVQREGLSVVSGALAVRSRIQKSIDLLVAEIEQQGIPDDFPLEECVAQLEDLTSQIVLSKNRSIESIYYDAYLAAGDSYSRHELSTSLGSIGALYAVFGHLAGILDEVLKIETTTEVVKVATAAGNAALFYSGTYSIEGLAEGIKVFTRVAAPTAIVVDLHKILEYGNPEEAYYSIPQEMMLALPIELSNLWMLTGDVESYVRYLAGIPLEQDIPIGESPCIVEVHPGESIQEAIDSAPEGCKVLVHPGVYTESLEILKSLSVEGVGEGSEGVTILGSVDVGDRYTYPGEDYEERTIVLRNLVFDGGTARPVGLDIGPDSVTIENCVVERYARFGIRTQYMGNLKILGCTVQDNTGIGIRVGKIGEAEIRDCEIIGNGHTGIQASWADDIGRQSQILGANNVMRGNGIDLVGAVSASLRCPIVEETSQSLIRVPDDCLDLQTAIDRVRRGGTIVLTAPIETRGVTIWKPVVIRAEGNEPVLLSSRIGHSCVLSVVGGVEGVRVEKLDVVGARVEEFGWLDRDPVVAIYGKATLVDVSVKGLENPVIGVGIGHQGDAELLRCRIEGFLSGIHLIGQCHGLMRDCEISDCFHGIEAKALAECQIDSSSIIECTVGAMSFYLGKLIITKTEIRETGCGINGSAGGWLEISDSIISNSAIDSGQIGHGIYFIGGDHCFKHIESLANVEGKLEVNDCQILANEGYGICLYNPACVEDFDPEQQFSGTITGEGNIIPGSDEQNGNALGSLCPGTSLPVWPDEFLESASPEIPPIEPIPEPILVLDRLTRENVAEFLSQHPVGGKAWVRFERKRGVSKDEIYAVASVLKEQGYIQDYLRSPFGSRFAITWTTRKGSNYLRDPDMEEISESYGGMCRDFDGFVYEQNIMIALYEKDDIRVTGIQQDGSYARVEYMWKRGRTTPIFDILQPVISSNMVEAFSVGERYDYEAYFSLYDDGWRVEICY
jgi:hypothetical protein